VQRVARVLQSAGFPMAPDGDLPCLWFQVVKDEYLRLQTYLQYTGYTEEQHAFKLQEINNFKAETADDNALSAILQEYYYDIKDNAFIDIPYQEEKEEKGAG
jgi:hypothetical protein